MLVSNNNIGLVEALPNGQTTPEIATRAGSGPTEPGAAGAGTPDNENSNAPQSNSSLLQQLQQMLMNFFELLMMLLKQMGGDQEEQSQGAPTAGGCGKGKGAGGGKKAAKGGGGNGQGKAGKGKGARGDKGLMRLFMMAMQFMSKMLETVVNTERSQ